MLPSSAGLGSSADAPQSLSGQFPSCRPPRLNVTPPRATRRSRHPEAYRDSRQSRLQSRTAHLGEYQVRIRHCRRRKAALNFFQCWPAWFKTDGCFLASLGKPPRRAQAHTSRVFCGCVRLWNPNARFLRLASKSLPKAHRRTKTQIKALAAQAHWRCRNLRRPHSERSVYFLSH